MWLIIPLSLALLLSFYLLAKICDKYFVVSLDKIADRLNMSHDAAGATLMAVGSSAPELFVSIIALIKPGNHAAIGMGTIVGSAIFNMLAIIGGVALVRRSTLAWQPIIRDALFYILSIGLLLYAFMDGKISFGEAAVFVIFYLVYVIVVIQWRKILKHDEEFDAVAEIKEEIEEVEKAPWEKYLAPLDNLLDFLFPTPSHFYGVFFMSIVLIAGISWGLVESAIAMSHILHIPEAIIALTVLAMGTSVPDLLSSLIVAKEGRGNMAVTNAIGSNIFDILFGLGLPWMIRLGITKDVIMVSKENLLSSTILLLASVVLVFFLIIVRRWSLGPKSGFVMIGAYVAYLVWAIWGVI